jgi:hypothetical protein
MNNWDGNNWDGMEVTAGNERWFWLNNWYGNNWGWNNCMVTVGMKWLAGIIGMEITGMKWLGYLYQNNSNYSNNSAEEVLPFQFHKRRQKLQQ